MESGESRKSLAEEILKLVRFRLQKKLPVLGAAFSAAGAQWSEEASGTDAEMLYWNADEVLMLFREGTKRLERKYLHLILHGLYLHRFRRHGCPERVWWLACDLMTEYRIDRMHVPGFDWPIPESRSRWYRKIREAGAVFYERGLAGWIQEQNEPGLLELERIFRKDNHEWWRETAVPDQEELTEKKQERAERTDRSSEAVHRWRTVFEQLEMRQEEHRRQAGGSRGSQAEQIVLQKERGYDYRQFLKQFAVSQEELSLDMDSFDYIPYDYSRRMYERLVFLEPLEYRERKKLQEFVIAIDTSGSCSGEIVRRFLRETWEIFKEKDNFFRDMRIHLIQCDCLIQEHVCVTCEEEWKDYLEHMTVKGHGDTDFTPVFRLVERMMEKGEVKHLKGLLYFTDGDGIYPEQKPDYDTAFVFLNEELRKGRAPDWALTLTLDAELET
ncbi:MAG: hypothetical protein HFI16_13290 [Lachnospiraceae bacterium]|nr:hypothetical protein [Lachnospiraceae bacterium]